MRVCPPDARERWRAIAEHERTRAARRSVLTDRIRDAMTELGLDETDTAHVLRAFIRREAR